MNAINVVAKRKNIETISTISKNLSIKDLLFIISTH